MDSIRSIGKIFLGIVDMRVLIIGSGSIGRRHAQNIKKLIPEAEIIFLRRGLTYDKFIFNINAIVVDNWGHALKLAPTFAVIASPSSLHIESLQNLLKNNVPCLIEKPVVTDLQQVDIIESILRNYNIPPTLVGCNLRYLPSLRKFRQIIRQGKIGNIVRVSIQVGHWLPDWRPYYDYRACYSYQSSLGGGVVFDLIHELDMVRWIFGDFNELHAVGGHFSSLDLKTEDTALILMSRPGGPSVTISMDYISRKPIRKYEVVGDRASLTWDLQNRYVKIIDGINSHTLCNNEHYFNVSNSYETEMQEMIDIVTHGKQSSHEIHEGLITSKIAASVNDLIRKT